MTEIVAAARRLAECCSYFGSTSYCLERCPYKERVTDGNVSWNNCGKKYDEDIQIIVNYILSMEDDARNE